MFTLTKSISILSGNFVPKAREKFQHQIKLRFNCIKTGRSSPELAAVFRPGEDSEDFHLDGRKI